jgi:hypothetical protein
MRGSANEGAVVAALSSKPFVKDVTKSCLKVDNGLLHRTASLKLKVVRLYTTKGCAQCDAAFARHLLRVDYLRYVPVGLYLEDCVRCVVKLIPGRKERACSDRNIGCKYTCPKLE